MECKVIFAINSVVLLIGFIMEFVDMHMDG